MTRHEFTAPDGSRRWCSEEVHKWERMARCTNRAAWSECMTCHELRADALDLLSPQPSGLRWVPSSTMHRMAWELLDSNNEECEYRGRVVLPTQPLNKHDDWLAVRGRILHCGTLADCARALVAAVRGEP